MAATLAGAMYASWALTLHLPRIIYHPAARTPDFPAGYGGDRGELTSLFICVAFWGAAWVVASSMGVKTGSGVDDSIPDDRSGRSKHLAQAGSLHNK